MSGAMPQPGGRWWPAAAVFLVACLPYIETPWFGFVAHDDPGHVVSNPVVREGLTLRGMAWAFGVGAEPAVDGWLNWPLTWLSHMTDVSLFGRWAGGHHLVSVLFHAVNATLVLAIAGRLGLTMPGALSVAAIFAVHPAQVESVAWVSERKTVLCGCLMLLAVLAYLRWRELVTSGGNSGSGRRGLAWLVGWNVLGGLALLAKPLAVTLPCLLLLLDAVPLGRIRTTAARSFFATLARCLPEKLPLCFAVAATCAGTIAAQAHLGAVTDLPLVTRLAHAVVAYATYLRVFLWPVGFGAIHQHPGMPTPAAFTSAAVLLLTVTALAVAAARRGRPLPLVGWCWFLGTLMPMIGIVQVGSNGWSERYLYLPIVGLAVAGAAVVEHLARSSSPAPRRTGSLSPRLAGAAVAIWIAGLAGLAWWQAGQWRDTPTLAARTLAANPARPGQRLRPGDATARWYALTWLAADAVERRDLAAAERWLLEAEAIPEFPQKEAFLQGRLGRLMLDTGRDAEAARRFTAALKHAPRDVPSRVGLGLAVLRGGDAARAAGIFEDLTEDQPRLPLPWVGLASALLELGRPVEAATCCERALALAPADRGALAVLEAARLATAERSERGP